MTIAITDDVQEMSSCLDNLRARLNGLDDNGITQTLRDFETLSRKTHMLMLEAVAEAETRGIAAREGFGGTARLLASMLRLSATEARTRVEHAAAVGTRRTITGEALSPRLPATAAGLGAGAIGTAQLRLIAETMAALPTSVPEPVRERVEADLARYARDFDPRRLRTLAQRLVATLDPDGPEPAEDDPAPGAPVRGELWLRDRRDGRLGLEGWLDPEHGSMVRSLIEQLATPGRSPERVTDGVAGNRSVAQRHADALIELCERARGADDFPATGGEPPHLTVTIDWDALRAAVEPLDVGRATRTAPLGIRRALIARDGGCSFPGCHRPPGICAVHHVRHWADGGDTGVCNCCLLCPMHHQQVHLQGWDVTIHGGRVEFRPPAVIDPERKPLTNPLRN